MYLNIYFSSTQKSSVLLHKLYNMACTKLKAILYLEIPCLSPVLMATNLLARTVEIATLMDNGMEFSLFVKVYCF